MDKLLSFAAKKKDEIKEAKKAKEKESSEESDDGGNDIITKDDAGKLFAPVAYESSSVVIWGKWLDESQKPMPVKFNVADNRVENLDEEDLLKKIDINKTDNEKVKDIIFGKQFKLVLFENGQLYSWGISSKGCLGLGSNLLQTHNKLERVRIQDKVKSVKVGTNHVLALTTNGKVYAWGDNTFGQVGVQTKRIKDARTKEHKRSKVVFEPTLIYNPARNKDNK